MPQKDTETCKCTIWILQSKLLPTFPLY